MKLSDLSEVVDLQHRLGSLRRAKRCLREQELPRGVALRLMNTHENFTITVGKDALTSLLDTEIDIVRVKLRKLGVKLDEENSDGNHAD